MSTAGSSRAGVSSPSCPYCGAPGPARDLGGLHWTGPGSGRPGKALRRRRRFRRARRVLAGIDPFAIVRVTTGYFMDKPDQGGATLYQQLAKILYVPGASGVPGKGEQILLGIKLDLSYPKARILQMYSDVAYFGEGYYGLQAASCGYFGVAPAALTWPQAALLAGLVQAPSGYDPLVHPALARAREAHVLGRLAATGALTHAQAELAYRQPLHLTEGRTGRCSVTAG